MKQTSNPIVLIGAGVGFTPMLSMLETLVSSKHGHQVTYVHCVKNANQHSFASHVDKLVEDLDHFTSNAFYSQPNEKKLNLNKTKVHHGRLNKDALEKILSNPKKSEFYLCGPKEFILTIIEVLKKNFLVPEQNISFEYFAPQLQ